MNQMSIGPYEGLRESIERDRIRREQIRQTEREQAEAAKRKPFSDFESARDTVEKSKSHETGWMKNPDRVTVNPYIFYWSGFDFARQSDDAAFLQTCAMLEAAEAETASQLDAGIAAAWQHRQDMAAQSLRDARDAGTLTQSIDAALVQFNAAMEDAGWRQQQPMPNIVKSHLNPTPDRRSWFDLERENATLRKELEIERLRVAACGVVATSDAPNSAVRQEYMTEACEHVVRRVDECIQLRASLAEYVEALDRLARMVIEAGLKP